MSTMKTVIYIKLLRLNEILSLKKSDFCSHRRSWHFYSESVRAVDQQTFRAVLCASWKDFIENNCPENETMTQDYMGYYASDNLTGDYFLQTNQESPFNRGPRGMYYDESVDVSNDIENSIE